MQHSVTLFSPFIYYYTNIIRDIQKLQQLNELTLHTMFQLNLLIGCLGHRCILYDRISNIMHLLAVAPYQLLVHLYPHLSLHGTD